MHRQKAKAETKFIQISNKNKVASQKQHDISCWHRQQRAEIILYCRGECILYGGLSSGSTTFNKGIVTLLQSSRKLGTSLSVGWKLARSEWASSSGSSGPSASSRESVSRMKPAEIHSKTHISQLAFWLFCFFWLLTPASVHI